MKAKTLPQRILVTIENPGTEDEYYEVTAKGKPSVDVGEKKNGAWYVLEIPVVVEGFCAIVTAPTKLGRIKRK